MPHAPVRVVKAPPEIHGEPMQARPMGRHHCVVPDLGIGVVEGAADLLLDIGNRQTAQGADRGRPHRWILIFRPGGDGGQQLEIPRVVDRFKQHHLHRRLVLRPFNLLGQLRLVVATQPAQQLGDQQGPAPVA